MEKVQVHADNGSYDILIGNDLLNNEYLKSFEKSAIITDDVVYDLYGKRFAGTNVIVLKSGEESKNMQNLEMIYDRLMDFGLDRNSVLAAVGGGVVGDICGFAAATFKRGVRFVQYPTTLLAQVDSSVGGKVAVNLRGGKNMVGAFYQPCAVFADTSALDTLDERQYAAGMAEVVKYAYIADKGLHQTLVQQSADIGAIVKRCCEIKTDYVHQDPYDTGIRMQLNYGHTIGHAIETVAGYGTFLHGEAIAIGMVYAAHLGEQLGISPKGLASDTISLLRKYKLPVMLKQDILDQALQILLADKKADGKDIHFVLIDQIGHAVLKKLPAELIQKTVKEMKV